MEQTMKTRALSLPLIAAVVGAFALVICAAPKAKADPKAGAIRPAAAAWADGTIADKAKRLFGERRGSDGTEGKHLLDKVDFADDPEMLRILDTSLDGKVSEQEFVEFYQRSSKRYFRRNVAYAENKAENRQSFNISVPIADLSLDTDCFQRDYDAKVQRAIKKAPALPVILFFHGGGLNMWEKDGRINFLRRVVGEELDGKFVLASVGYRTTKFATWPAQINDVKSSIRHLKKNAGKFRIDPNRIGVSGFSAGAGLCESLATSGHLVKTLEGDVGVKYDPKNGIDSIPACVLPFSGGGGGSIFDKSINNPQAIERLLKTAFEEDNTTNLDDVLSKRMGGRPYIRTKENGYSEHPGSSLYGSGYDKAHYPMISTSPRYVIDFMDSPAPPILNIAGGKDQYGSIAGAESFVKKCREHKCAANIIRVMNMPHDKDYLFLPKWKESHREAIQNIRHFLMKHLYDEDREIKDLTVTAPAEK